ncbi:hypothetical protein JCM10212_004331 [Sporobolomyces blumeae]
MSFWKFKSAFAPPPTDGINAILSGLPPDESSPAASTVSASADAASSSSAGPRASTSSLPDAVDPTPWRDALDRLLAEPDLLNEIKSGSNARLTDFLARREVVLRLGGWVVWGLGRGMEFKAGTATESNGANGGKSVAMDRRKGSLLETGVLPDDLEDGKVPDEVVRAEAERERVGMGGTPRRKEVELDDERRGEAEASDATQDSDDAESKWENFPRICTEILAGSPPSLSDTLFQHEAASSLPHLCPTPGDFLMPFWESVLGSTEQQLAVRAAQVGFWARINSVLLDGPYGRQAVDQILRIPHLLPRLLALLPFCSPINDLLLVLLRVSRPPSPLIPSTVNQSIRMLDPFSALGKPGHVAAEELLRGIIELCSAVPKPQLGGPGGMLGQTGTMQDEQAFEWRDTTLARQIAEEKTVKTLLDWMLADVQETRIEGEGGKQDDSGVTERDKASGSDVGKGGGAEEEALRRRDLRTSSLVASIAVLVDLIRKNNSDFVEQQMLSWARRKEGEALEREMLEADGGQVVGGSSMGENGEVDPREDKGPSVVDLGAMLTVVAERIGGLQALIRNPRSSTAPVKTAAGLLAPLTLERFRICELYAELLHCSNMSLLNRPDRTSGIYDSNGYLATGWRAADDLARALAGPIAPEDDNASDHSDALPPSPGLTATKSPYSTSPGGQSFPSTSGLSTPSGRESLDEESGGVLTKSEAKALKQIVELAREQSEAEEGGQVEQELDAREKAAKEGESDDAESTATERRRKSVMSNGTVATMESDFAATPSIYSVQSRQLPSAPLAPGPLLKTRFMEHGVIKTMLDLFFDYPWNNFLHNVVFDIIQQIFHGRIDRPLDRQLALSLFLDGRLCERLLDGQKRNDEAAAKRANMRLGYMGHLSLIADETVKFFERYPDEILAFVGSSVPQPEWNQFVASTLRDLRERDSTPLSGSGPLQLPTMEQTHSSGFDDDDEFPMNSSRAMRATEAADGLDKGTLAAESGEASLTDQFSRYLANAISSDRTDKFGSSDEDDEDDANWLGGGRFDPGDVDFALDTESSRTPRSFGFDDRFDEAGPTAFRSAGSDSDEEWAPFEGNANSNDSPLSTDPFTPTVASSTAADGFENSFGSNFASGSGTATGGTDEDWGDFEGAEGEGDDGFGGPSTFGSGPSITLPPMDAFDDFDFGESSRPTISLPTASDAPFSSSTESAAFDFARPAFGRQETSDAMVDDGSSMFGRLSIGSSTPTSPVTQDDQPLPAIDAAVADARDEGADRATDDLEPLGPSMHSNAHVTDDGFVEAEVNGKVIRVPADDIVLAHRRRSSRSSSLSSEPDSAAADPIKSDPPAAATPDSPAPSSSVLDREQSKEESELPTTDAKNDG